MKLVYNITINNISAISKKTIPVHMNWEKQIFCLSVSINIWINKTINKNTLNALNCKKYRYKAVIETFSICRRYFLRHIQKFN